MDLRAGLNAISDVIVNRPPPLREFDQIYMKAADMLLQAEHVSRWLNDKRTVFVGDGDAISLCLLHLQKKELFKDGPSEVLVLDFDERVLNAIECFAGRYDLHDRITTRLYNVVDPLPEDLWHQYDAFYTNPPFGASNDGMSVEVFLRRGMECTGADSIGCVAIADDQTASWSQSVLRTTQVRALDCGFLIAELLPSFHTYHLDDAPNLTSCSMILRRVHGPEDQYCSTPLSSDDLRDFYGRENPLRYRYVRDHRNGGRFPSKDHEFEPLESENYNGENT